MNEILFDLGVSALLVVLKSLPKSETKKRQFKNVMLKIWTKIGEVYADDEAFKK